MELFHEESVSKKNPMQGMILYKLYTVSMVLFILLALAALAMVGAFADPTVGYALVLIFGIFAAVCFFLKDRQIIEYDYSFVNGSFTVSRIINNRSRKELLTTEVTDWNVFGTVGDQHYTHARESASVVKAYLNQDETLYYAVYTSNNRKYMLIFEPSESLVDCINKSSKTGRRNAY